MSPAVLLALFAVAAAAPAASGRTVNISNAWFLPQEGYPVFYRYFRDRITWFEADAVCQFHHANLVTVETSAQFDATRAYLRELDVTSYVWIGLKRNGPNEPFLWPNYSAVDPSASAAGGGSWLEQAASGGGPQCAAADPAADFRWHSLGCGGPAVASFICELPVPSWARAEDGCLLTSLPSLTVTFLPEQAAVELAADCGLEGTRRVACRGQASREDMERQLACDQEVTTTVSTSTVAAATTIPTALPTVTTAGVTVAIMQTSEAANTSPVQVERATTEDGVQETSAASEAPQTSPVVTDDYFASSVSSGITGGSDATHSSPPKYDHGSTASDGGERQGTLEVEATPPPPPPSQDAGGGGGAGGGTSVTAWPLVTEAASGAGSEASEAAVGEEKAAPAPEWTSGIAHSSVTSASAEGARAEDAPPPTPGGGIDGEVRVEDPLQYEPEAPVPRGGRKRRLQRPQDRGGSVYPYLLRVLG